VVVVRQYRERQADRSGLTCVSYRPAVMVQVGLTEAKLITRTRRFSGAVRPRSRELVPGHRLPCWVTRGANWVHARTEPRAFPQSIEPLASRGNRAVDSGRSRDLRL